MISATADFKITGNSLSSRNMRNAVYDAFAHACRVLRFPGDFHEAFEIGVSSYGTSSRSYHDWDHGSLMTLVPRHEIVKLRRAVRLTQREEKRIVALLTYSGLFHDVAYEQVDGGLEKDVAEIAKNYVTVSAGPPWRATLREDIDATPVGKTVRTMFGLEPGQIVADMPVKDAPSVPSVMNEFLSALTAAHLLVGGKTPDEQMIKQIASAAAMIEATVPFRPQSVFEDMFKRLRKFNLSEREAEITTKAAVMLANRDVQDFCGGPIEEAVKISKQERFHIFVAGTWQLMPESNMNLRGENYAPSEYLASLRKSHFFLTAVVKPDQVFHSFGDFPDKEEMRLRQEYAGQNLKLLDRYVTAKIASASIVEAIAQVIESGESLKELMNGVKNELPGPVNGLFQDDDLIVYNTLRDRGAEAPRHFDIKESPIARYIMQTAGKEAIDGIVALSNKYMPLNNPGARDHRAFLEEIVREMPQGAEIMNEIVRSMKMAAEESADAKSPDGKEMPELLRNARLHRAGKLQELADSLGLPLRNNQTPRVAASGADLC